jgi:hypothetical protein
MQGVRRCEWGWAVEFSSGSVAVNNSMRSLPAIVDSKTRQEIERDANII